MPHLLKKIFSRSNDWHNFENNKLDVNNDLTSDQQTELFETTSNYNLFETASNYNDDYAITTEDSTKSTGKKLKKDIFSEEMSCKFNDLAALKDNDLDVYTHTFIPRIANSDLLYSAFTVLKANPNLITCFRLKYVKDFIEEQGEEALTRLSQIKSDQQAKVCKRALENKKSFLDAVDSAESTTTVTGEVAEYIEFQ